MTIRHTIQCSVHVIACMVMMLSHAVIAQPNPIRAFMDEGIECERYVFAPGRFPPVRWKNEARVGSELGSFPLKVTYFNGAWQHVTSAETPGRYGAVVEGTTASGFIVKRYLTLFCSAVEYDDYSRNVPLTMTNLREYGITGPAWEQYEKNLERFSFGSMKSYPQHDADAAIFLAGLRELNGAAAIFDTPRMKDRQWWITMKRTLEGKALTEKAVLRYATAVKNSPGRMADNGGSPLQYDREQIEKVRTVCRAWADKGGVAHVTLVAHKGKIILNEAFGADDDGSPLTVGAKMWMASITKLLTGVLMMQFVEQGLVDLDAPVSRYLPELNVSGNEKLTVRHLFTHTSGFSFAGEWASDWNPALENQIAHCLPSVEVGASFSYNRVGYALAGKILERMTGRAVPYLFHDYIFAPLGMGTAYSDNTYGGLYCSAFDLAQFGEMLLHKGAYNGCTLFSEQTFEQMLPRRLPVGDRPWGIGTTSYGGHGLSDAAFGHGAASGTVLRIDPTQDLIIISARNTPGIHHGEYEAALIESCTALVRGH